MPLHKAPLSLGRAPHGGALLLEVSFGIAGQVTQACAQSGPRQHGHQQGDAGLRAHLPPQPSEGAADGRLRAGGVAGGLADGCLGEAADLDAPHCPRLWRRRLEGPCALSRSPVKLGFLSLTWLGGGERLYPDRAPTSPDGVCPGWASASRLASGCGSGCGSCFSALASGSPFASISRQASGATLERLRLISGRERQGREAATAWSARLLPRTLGWRIPRLRLPARGQGAVGEHAF